FFFFQAEDGIRDYKVTGVQTCALPIFIEFLEDRRAGVTRSGSMRLIGKRVRAARVVVVCRARSAESGPAGLSKRSFGDWPLSARSEGRRVGKGGRCWGWRRDEE